MLSFRTRSVKSEEALMWRFEKGRAQATYMTDEHYRMLKLKEPLKDDLGTFKNNRQFAHLMSTGVDRTNKSTS